MELDSRKVQKLGYSSLGVSLPKPWAESNGIQPGSVVNMSIEDDGTLRVRVGPFEEYPTAAEATIDADSWSGPESLTRLITGNYIVGCNTIKVRSRDEISPGQLQEIHEAVRGLTGPAMRSGRPPTKDLVKTVGGLKARLEKIIELTMTSFFASDLKKANEALDLQMALVRDLRQLGLPPARSRANSTKAPSNLLGIILRPLEHVSKYYGTIAQVTINRVLESPLRPRPAHPEPSTATAASTD